MCCVLLDSQYRQTVSTTVVVCARYCDTILLFRIYPLDGLFACTRWHTVCAQVICKRPGVFWVKRSVSARLHGKQDNKSGGVMSCRNSIDFNGRGLYIPLGICILGKRKRPWDCTESRFHVEFVLRSSFVARRVSDAVNFLLGFERSQTRFPQHLYDGGLQLRLQIGSNKQVFRLSLQARNRKARLLCWDTA